jgi:hypothetical protein
MVTVPSLPEEEQCVTAKALCAHLREHDPSTVEEWRAYAAIIQDLILTLKHEPLTFEDAFAMALIEARWEGAEVWPMARKAAREIPSRLLREALERELQGAWNAIEELKVVFPSEDETREEYLDRVMPL